MSDANNLSEITPEMRKMAESLFMPKPSVSTTSDPFETAVTKLTKQRDDCRRSFDSLHALIVVNLEHGNIKCEGKAQLIRVMDVYKSEMEESISL